MYANIKTLNEHLTDNKYVTTSLHYYVKYPLITKTSYYISPKIFFISIFNIIYNECKMI